MDIAGKYFLENNLNSGYTLKQKIYYDFVRPVTPLKLRKLLQQQYGSGIKYHENFINNEFIEFASQNEDLLSSINEINHNGYSSAVVLTHDVEDENGMRNIPNVLALEEKYNFKSSWNFVPYKYQIDEGIIRLIQKSGHEIGIHGYNHDGKLFSSEKEFNNRVPYINAALKKYNAVGFRSPMVHRNLEWISRLDIFYDSSTFDYDPFQPFPGGNGFIWPFSYKTFIELPYTLPQDHTLFYVLKQSGIELWLKKIEWIIKHRGIVLILTHPDYLIEQNKLDLYENLLSYLSNLQDVWRCLPNEAAKWWQKRLTPIQ